MEEYLRILRKQRYQIVGSHSAVKGCLWFSKSMRGLDFCYKGKFYGIRSHRCVQMTPSIECNQRCIFCWRPVEFEFKVDRWDPPEAVVDGVLEAHRRILWGYKGSPKTDMDMFAEALEPKHVAISLIGEPTLYPHLPRLVRLFMDRGMTTFVVSNATNPDMVEKISPTMLYLSLDAPDRDVYMRVCRPLSDYWDKIIESLKIMGERRGEIKRTIRITLVKSLNDFGTQKYAELLRLASPDFIEVKAYMHLGYSRKRLSRNFMPSHSEVLDFATNIGKNIGYEVADQSEISRVVLLTKDGKKDLFIGETS